MERRADEVIGVELARQRALVHAHREEAVGRDGADRGREVAEEGTAGAHVDELADELEFLEHLAISQVSACGAVPLIL